MENIVLPKNDYAFKILFGDKRNKPLLKSLLESILGKNIEDVYYTSEELQGDIKTFKKSILDVRVTLKDGVDVNIEIQVNRKNEMSKRSFYYESKMFSSQLSKSEDYSLLNKVICINILDFVMQEESEAHSKYVLMNPKTQKELKDTIEIHFIQLKLSHICDEGSKLKEWMEFLRMTSFEEVTELANRNEFIKKALEELERINNDPEKRMAYEAREKELRDQISEIKAAEEEGEKRGEKKGEKNGYINTARSLFKLNMSEHDILKNIEGLADYLSLEDLKEIKNDLMKK